MVIVQVFDHAALVRQGLLQDREKGALDDLHSFVLQNSTVFVN